MDKSIRTEFESNLEMGFPVFSRKLDTAIEEVFTKRCFVENCVDIMTGTHLNRAYEMMSDEHDYTKLAVSKNLYAKTHNEYNGY